MVGALTASDTLMPRAFGAGRYDEVGRLAIRGFFLCALLLVFPVIPLCTAMERLFDALGQDKRASSLASQWIRVYLVGLPSVLLFRVIQCFLNAHNMVWPLVYASMTASFLAHPLFLRIFIPKLGFLGSAWAIASTQTTMTTVLLIYLYLRPSTYKAEAWPGLSLKILREALQPGPVWAFLSLSLGGVLSLSVRPLANAYFCICPCSF
jgi:Na+-driven multidrug efflux pump